jgi:hypothetical protein
VGWTDGPPAGAGTDQEECLTMTPAVRRPRSSWPDRPTAPRHVLAVVCLALAMAPRPSPAAGCDDWLRQTVRVTGSYVPVEEAYSRPFVFAMLLDCHGSTEAVTVQRATASLPVCAAGQSVEVVGKLMWNKTLVDGHYEINDPSSVTCNPPPESLLSSEARKRSGGGGPEIAQTPALPAPPSPPAPAAPPAVSDAPPQIAREIGPRLWIGRYRDSRGEGDMTFSLVQGASTVSGTWKLRTGGGGPLTGVADASGRRFRLRMENTAPECPGIFNGWVEIRTTTLVGAYRGKDCDGPVADGLLELRPK